MKRVIQMQLMPIGVFLVLYLGLGIVFEYVMKYRWDFTTFQLYLHLWWQF